MTAAETCRACRFVFVTGGGRPVLGMCRAHSEAYLGVTLTDAHEDD